MHLDGRLWDENDKISGNTFEMVTCDCRRKPSNLQLPNLQLVPQRSLDNWQIKVPGLWHSFLKISDWKLILLKSNLLYAAASLSWEFQHWWPPCGSPSKSHSHVFAVCSECNRWSSNAATILHGRLRADGVPCDSGTHQLEFNYSSKVAMNHWVDAMFHHSAAKGAVGFGSNLLDCQGL